MSHSTGNHQADQLLDVIVVSSKNEIADYLERYAAINRLPVTTGEAIARLGQSRAVLR